MVLPEVRVPFADLYAQYLSIKQDIDEAIAGVIKTSAFVRGAYVERFEAEFASTVGVKHCVSCANGTDALYIAMHALGVKPGDEVIAPAHSWIATTETITQAGGKVVFCDTDRVSYTIDTKSLEAKITSRTVGIIPVHLYGQAANMAAIMALAAKHRLWVIEDCAQAHLARHENRLVGSFGNVGTFSFYPGKNLGAMGDAGAVVTNDRVLAERMAKFARHGGLRKGEHEIEGINSRLDGLQAAILSAKLPHLVRWTKRRQEIASEYDRRLKLLREFEIPATRDGNEHVYHLYVIQHEMRDALAAFLANRGIQTVINYPVALPFLHAYSRFGHKPGDFPNAHRNQARILSLPLFPELSSQQFECVMEALERYSEQH